MSTFNPEMFAVLPAVGTSDGERAVQWIEQFRRRHTDPASQVIGQAPLNAQNAVPHLTTFQSLLGSFAKTYQNPDEAIQDSIQNAHLMTRDVGILECLDNRRRLTALLDWEIVPEDEKHPGQKAVAESLTKMIRRIKRFQEYRYWLMMGIWSGRSGIQHRYGYVNINNRMRIIPKPLHHDHYGWMPINGDKLVFRYDDGRHNRDPGAYPHQCGIRVAHTYAKNSRFGDYNKRIEPTGDGLAIFLRSWERDTLCIHKHFIEDADYHHARFAGSIHGIGIRSKIYWEWWLKQEAMAFLMQYLERSAGGTEIYTYPSGDSKAKVELEQVAREKSANGRNVIFFPRPMGEDAMSYEYNVVEPGAVGLDIIKDIVQNYFGGRIKRYILGQVLTTEAEATGLGSGVADAHMDTLQQIVRYDAGNLDETLTSELVLPLQRYNYPETLGWHMSFQSKVDDDEAQARLESLQSAYEMGCRIPEAEVLDVVGVRKPRDGERVLEVGGGGMGMGMPGMGGPPAGLPVEDGDGDGRTGIPEMLDDNMMNPEGIPQVEQYSVNGGIRPERTRGHVIGRINKGKYQSLARQGRRNRKRWAST